MCKDIEKTVGELITERETLMRKNIEADLKDAETRVTPAINALLVPAEKLKNLNKSYRTLSPLDFKTHAGSEHLKLEEELFKMITQDTKYFSTTT